MITFICLAAREREREKGRETVESFAILDAPVCNFLCGLCRMQLRLLRQFGAKPNL